MPEDQTNEPAPKLDARHLLIDWANHQDGWVRRLVGQVIASQRPIGEEQTKELFELFLAEKGLDGTWAEVEPKLPYPAAGSAQADPLRLLSLSKVSGVNALSPGATIDFSPGLTILYGENGTGKTGYARILKRISAVQYPEKIIPNVNSTAAQTPAATIEYELGGVHKSIEWNDEVGVSPFTRMSVFDSPSVNIRVDDSLSYVFTPAEISLFSFVSSGIQAIQELGSKTQREITTTNPFIGNFERGTTVYQEIEALGSATDLDALMALAKLPEDANMLLEQLEREVAALRSDTVSVLLAMNRSALQNLKKLDAVAQRVKAFEVDKYNEGVLALGTLRESYRRVREETFSLGELPGPADDEWQRFVTAAAKYLEHLGSTHYPQDGDKCIYCRQPFDQNALSIVPRYSTFLNNTLGQQISEQQQAVASIAATLTSVSVDEVDGELSRWDEEGSTSNEYPDAEELARKLKASIAQIQAGEQIAYTDLGEHAGEVRKKLVPLLEERESTVATLADQLDDRDAALQVAEDKLRQLAAAIELDRRLPEIRNFVKNSKRAAKLDQVLKRLTPLLRSLTEKSKLASEDLVNSDFQGRFEQECTFLRTPTVRLDFIGRKGKAQRRKSLTSDHRLSEILSEGEQKVLAIADFLAESGMAGSSTPIVFDDPVNSLDHRRLREVSDRIAALVSTRQVVVFTHNIWLATELLSRFEKRPDECVYYKVSDDETTGAIGKIDRATGPRWDTTRALKKQVNSLLQEASEATAASQTALVEAAFGQMRSWCEVVVEEVIFGDVSRRYRANIMMGGFRNVHPERMQALIDVVVQLFNDACRYIPDHSQPLHTLSTRPTLAEAQARWSAALDAVSAYQNPSN